MTDRTDTKLRAVLIDDEANCLKMLQWELSENCPEIEVVRTCTSGKAGLIAVKEERPDVVFLDIEMPYLNGFEVLELTPERNFAVVFTTAYDKFAVRAFKSSAVDYLLKPIDGADLRRAADKIIGQRSFADNSSNIDFLLRQIEDLKNDRLKRVALPTFEGTHFAEIDKIVHCQADNNYTKVYFADGNKVYISKTLKEVAEIIDSPHFYRSHNSYLVNLNHVSSYLKNDGGMLLMSNGDEVKVSRSRRERLFELMTER